MIWLWIIVAVATLFAVAITFLISPSDDHEPDEHDRYSGGGW